MARPRKTDIAPTGLGALLGGALGGPAGILIGGVLGGVVGTTAVPLDEALKQKVAEFKLTFESLRRVSRYEVHVLVRDPFGRFWAIPGTIPPQTLEGDVLDDALYDAAVAQLKRFAVEHGYAQP